MEQSCRSLSIAGLVDVKTSDLDYCSLLLQIVSHLCKCQSWSCFVSFWICYCFCRAMWNVDMWNTEFILQNVETWQMLMVGHEKMFWFAGLLFAGLYSKSKDFRAGGWSVLIQQITEMVWPASFTQFQPYSCSMEWQLQPRIFKEWMFHFSCVLQVIIQGVLRQLKPETIATWNTCLHN